MGLSMKGRLLILKKFSVVDRELIGKAKKILSMECFPSNESSISMESIQKFLFQWKSEGLRRTVFSSFRAEKRDRGCAFEVSVKIMFFGMKSGADLGMPTIHRRNLGPQAPPFPRTWEVPLDPLLSRRLFPIKEN